YRQWFGESSGACAPSSRLRSRPRRPQVDADRQRTPGDIMAPKRGGARSVRYAAFEVGPDRWAIDVWEREDAPGVPIFPTLDEAREYLNTLYDKQGSTSAAS